MSKLQHHKKCSFCGEVKPRTEFSFRNKTNPKYVRSACKKCVKLEKTFYRQNNPDRRLKDKEYNVKRCHDPIGHIKVLYGSICHRVKNNKRSLTFSLDDLFKFVESQQSKYNELYNNWKNSNYLKALSPGIDRIDNSKGYEIDNIQLMTHRANAAKGIKKTGISASEHPNVTFENKKWVARFEYKTVDYYLGRFENESEAVAAIKNKRKELVNDC